VRAKPARLRAVPAVPPWFQLTASSSAVLDNLRAAGCRQRGVLQVEILPVDRLVKFSRNHREEYICLNKLGDR
jgi:hypothetical protein